MLLKWCLAISQLVSDTTLADFTDVTLACEETDDHVDYDDLESGCTPSDLKISLRCRWNSDGWAQRDGQPGCGSTKEDGNS